MRAARQRLYINVDHVATLRQARRGAEPDPIAAAGVSEQAGADGITAHLREDRRHIQDDDVRNLKAQVKSYFNLELACVPAMIDIAIRVKPEQVTLVPERREEITTEGGLDVVSNSERVADAVARFKKAGIRTSLFIDPAAPAVTKSRELNVDAIELHTGTYAHGASGSLDALQRSAVLAASLGLAVHAGHGLTIANVGPVAAIPEIEELNIGHSIVSRALFVGLDAAVREMKAAMQQARPA